MGQGSCEPRTLKSGKVVYDLRWDEPGVGKKRVQKRLTFHGTEKKARAELDKRIEQAWGDGPKVDREAILGDLLDEWLAHNKGRWRPQSWTQMEVIARLHIKPTLGEVKVDALRPKVVQAWVRDREQAGLSPKYVRDMLRVLKQVLRFGMAMEIAERNVASVIDGPRDHDDAEPVAKAWTVEEAKRFFASEAKGDVLVMWLVAAVGQLRRAELAGLRWEDVDFDKNEIEIVRQMIPVTGGGLREAPPKTRKSKRVLPMPRAVMALLGEYLDAQEERRAEWRARGMWDHRGGWVFDNGLGGPSYPQRLYARFKVACERAGVPPIRLHDLRTTGITLLGEAGAHPWIVQERAGHTNQATTLGYVHPSVELQRGAIESLATLLGLDVAGS